jgi:hypothetical protein
MPAKPFLLSLSLCSVSLSVSWGPGLIVILLLLLLQRERDRAVSSWSFPKLGSKAKTPQQCALCDQCIMLPCLLLRFTLVVWCVLKVCVRGKRRRTGNRKRSGGDPIVPHPRSPPQSRARGKPKWGPRVSIGLSFQVSWERVAAAVALAGDPLQCMARADLLLCGLPSFHSDVRIGLEERNRTG